MSVLIFAALSRYFRRKDRKNNGSGNDNGNFFCVKDEK